ncbi:MAG: ligase-associated DNA damage response endonuclease PdeM [Pseudoxanthomonas sp.]
MAAEFELRVANEELRLLGDRAVYWPARRRLLIADLHLGKADVFRRAGIGLPQGGTAHDLQRLSRLLLETTATELWILGDMLHGPAPQAAWRDSWNAWRGQHAGLRIVALAGNHDRALAPAGLGIELAGESVEEGALVMRHEPRPHPHRHVLCGHVHPLATLPGIRRRWPAFWLRDGITVLPAFSHFTAGVAPRLFQGERLVACVEGEVVALPAPRATVGSRQHSAT